MRRDVAGILMWINIGKAMAIKGYYSTIVVVLQVRD